MATTASLIADYAQPIANSVNLTASDYDQTTEGLAELLRDTAGRLSSLGQTRSWLEDAATDLDAITRLGGNGSKTQAVLQRIDTTLYEARADLELA